MLKPDELTFWLMGGKSRKVGHTLTAGIEHRQRTCHWLSGRRHPDGRRIEARPRYPIDSHGAGVGILRGAHECWQAVNAAGYRYLYMDAPYWLAQKWRSCRGSWDSFQFCLDDGPDVRADPVAAGAVFEQRRGDTVYVCPQTDVVHRLVFGHKGVANWVEETVAELERHTDRRIVVREKDGRPGKILSMLDIPSRTASMCKVFDDAWAIVTVASSIAVEAVCRGVPVFVGKESAALPVGNTRLADIESPRMPDEDEVRIWAANLAARQYTQKDLTRGKAWRQISDDLEYMEEQCKRGSSAPARPAPGKSTRNETSSVGSSTPMPS